MKLKNLSQIILDLNICVAFIFVSMIFLRLIIPEGYTTEFFSRAYFLLALILLSLTILFVVSLFFINDFKIRKKIDLPDLKDIALLGLPMSPVISFIILNIEYLNIIGLILILVVTFIFCYFFTFILPSLLGYFGSYKMLMITGLSLSFTILNMAQINNNPTTHIFSSQFITQGLYLIGSFVITFILYSFNKKIAYTVIITFMLSGALISFLGNSTKKDPDTLQSLDRLKVFLENNKNKINYKNDIYILIFESYPNLETLKFYGYNNIEQISFLEKNNFTIYHGIYSKGSTSLSSTSRILELRDKFSKDDRHYMNGNSFILDAFKANGYETVALFTSPYAFGSSPIKWDEYHPKDDVTKIGGKTILKAIFEGYFRFDIFSDDYDYDKYLNIRKNYLMANNEKPTLFYTHGEYPGHSQNSGQCLKNEKQKYFKGMEKANLEMRNDVEILKKNNPNSIIVILGDHGPHLTKNCTALKKYEKKKIDKYDIQDRYGALLAIHWPKDLKINNFDIQIIQDIFPAILGNITNNKKLFDELRLDKNFLHKYDERIAGVNVSNGIIIGGKDNKKPLFNNRSYQLRN